MEPIQRPTEQLNEVAPSAYVRGQSSRSQPMRSITNMQAKYPKTVRSEGMNMRPISTDGMDRMEFIEADEPKFQNATFVFILHEMENPETTTEQLGALYLSALGVFFASIKDMARAHIQARGFEFHTIKVPSEAEANFLNFTGRTISRVDALVILGQLMLYPFKSLNQNNFENFMRQRVRAMSAQAGQVVRENYLVVMNTTIAENIRRMIGVNRDLRIFILDALMANCNVPAPVGTVFAYLLKILEWVEMGPLRFVNEVLIITKSPVLSHRAVLTEVYNLRNAFHEIAKDPTPQYWRIKTDNQQYHIVDRSQFPTLIEVAVTIRQDVQPSLRNFQSPDTRDKTGIVSELVNLHRMATTSDTHARHKHAVEDLLAYDE